VRAEYGIPKYDCSVRASMDAATFVSHLSAYSFKVIGGATSGSGSLDSSALRASIAVPQG